MDDTLANLLHRLSGETNRKTEELEGILSSLGLNTGSELLQQATTASDRANLQEEISRRASEEGVSIPGNFVHAFQMAVQDSRLAYSGFPEAPPHTSTAILFTAPHALHLQRPGHKPHQPEAFTQHLARDFARSVGGAFLTWTRREETRSKEYYRAKGEPDPTNRDPNFTHYADLEESPWTRNLREVRGLFGHRRACLHVDLHGCKDPSADGGSHLVVGLGAMKAAERECLSFFRLALQIILGIAIHGLTVNVEPKRLTGMSPDTDRQTLTQQSMTEAGGNWTYAVQLEMSRFLRRELSRNEDMRFLLAKAIMISWGLAYLWQWKPMNCPMYPLPELQDWLGRCKGFYSKRRAAVEEHKFANGADDEFDDEFTETTGVAVHETANNEPPPRALTDPVQDWWPHQWVRMCKDGGHGTAETLEDWLAEVTVESGDSRAPVTVVASEVQALRDWLHLTPQEDALRFSLCRVGAPQCYVVGSWCDWTPVQLDWDGFHLSHSVTIGDNGWESFQLLIDRRWDATLHPSCADACPLASYRLQGPDGKGHGLNWTIGCPPGKAAQHEKNTATPGDCFQIIVALDDRRNPCRVSWIHVA